MQTNGKRNKKKQFVAGLLDLPLLRDAAEPSPEEEKEIRKYAAKLLHTHFERSPVVRCLREHRIAQLRETWRGLVLQKMEKGQQLKLPSGDVIHLEEDMPFIFSVTATMMVTDTGRIDGELVINFDYRCFGYDMDETPIGSLIGTFSLNNSTVTLRF